MDDQTRRPQAARRFTLLDAMILVAAAALGFAATRWFDKDDDLPDLFQALISGQAWTWDHVMQVGSGMLVFAVPTAVCLTLGVVALRLREPCPRWRRLVRQPGLVACLVLGLSWGADGTFAVLNVLSLSSSTFTANGSPVRPDPIDYLSSFAWIGAPLGGFAVAIAWATLAVVGRWRPEPNWPDRLGRLVGLAWIALAVAGFFNLLDTRF